MYKIWIQVANLKIRLKFFAPLFVVISCGAIGRQPFPDSTELSAIIE
jgi:hypothetical protein